MQVQHNEEWNPVVSASHKENRKFPAPATSAYTYYEDSEMSRSRSDEMEENHDYEL